MTDSTTHDPAPAAASAIGGRAAIDDDAWLRGLITQHAGTLRRIAAASVGPDAADDVVSETFAVAWRERASFDPTIAGERAWLAGITLNRCRMLGRARRRWLRTAARSLPAIHAGDGNDDAAGRLDARRAAPALMAALRRLPEEQRAVLLLVAVADLTPTEVAAATGTPAATVRSHLLRARRAVAAELAADSSQTGAPHD